MYSPSMRSFFIKYVVFYKMAQHLHLYKQESNSYLLSPEKGQLCPPKSAFFYFGNLQMFSSGPLNAYKFYLGCIITLQAISPAGNC